MSHIIGLAGSLRRHSYNAGLLRAAHALFPAEIEIATIRGIPLYDADQESASGIPSLVESLKSSIAEADGLLLVTPEYNNSIPGVFKNAIDWLTRPPPDIAKVFHGKAVAVIGASPGGFGTILSQNAWLPVLRTLRTRHWLGGRLMISSAAKVFDDQGELIDPEARKQLESFVRGFIAFTQAG